MGCTRSPFSGGLQCCAFCTGPVNPDVITLTNANMKYSVQSLMFATGVAAISIVTWLQWLQLPPRGHGSWSGTAQTSWNYETESSTCFVYGGCSANDFHFVGYLVRFDSKTTHEIVPEWFEQVDGCVYVLGKRVIPRSQYQLFVSDNGSAPEAWPLTARQAKSFRRLDGDQLERLWNELQKEEPDLR